MTQSLREEAIAQVIADEVRLAALDRYDVLDSWPEPAFDRIAKLVRLIFGVESSVVSLIDAHRQWYKAADGMGARQVPVDQSFCRFVVGEGAPMVISDASLDTRFQDNPFVCGENGVRFYAGVPLTSPDGQHIGSVCAIDSHPRQFTDRELKILRELAQVAMSELELRRLAATDGLTGVSARRAFREDAERFIALARRHRTQLGVIAFDIDHFKSVNDTYGHAAGDLVLKAVAGAARAVLRQSDLIGRMGGEEFAIVLPDADAHAAMAVAEKLRHALLDLRFDHFLPPLRVSASFGIAALDPGSDDFDSVMVKADEALYEAKGAGRNRAIAWRGATAATTVLVDRRRVLKAGRLIFNNGQSVIDCTVRSLWDRGAEVQVSNSADIPEAVVLDMRTSGERWPATVAVRRATGLELEFA